MIFGLLLCCVLWYQAEGVCSSVGGVCDGNFTCPFGSVCANGKCMTSPAGLSCDSDHQCRGVFLDAHVFSCINRTCTMVSLPGDQCNDGSLCLGSCVGTSCNALPLGANCTSDQQCGVRAYCNKKTFFCTDVPFAGDACPDGVCQEQAFCNDQGVCSVLFSLPPGRNCSHDNQCVINALCVAGQCREVPSSYGYACPCPADSGLTCVSGRCLFDSSTTTTDVNNRMVGCRAELKEALACSARAGCYAYAAVTSSCNMIEGCYYDWAVLRNCLFCNTSVPLIAANLTQCPSNLCLNPGISTLVKVAISVGAISAFLLVLSVILYLCGAGRPPKVEYV